ncbi:MAG: hypothetical protein GTO24_22030, partial [candidate division Zixibacteria bacterium]|nr:hypothetical protein [candidate division Zixibacteria bacterium]
PNPARWDDRDTCTIHIARSREYEGLGLREAREALESDLIQRSLSQNKGNITRAAAQLGI